ncbi:MAG: cadherin-like domain-containing protein [Gemmataceae bacterium]
MTPHPTDDRRTLDDALFAGTVATDEPIPSYTYPDDDAQPPSLSHVGEVLVTWGETVPITPDTLALTGPPAVLIDVMVLSAPTKGALLRDGFALTGGDAFTQEDIDQGRISYRHDGEQPGDDRFSFATPAGEVPATDVRVVIPDPPRKAPVLTAAGSIGRALTGQRVGDLAGLGIALVGAAGRGRWERQSGDGWAELPEVQHGGALLLGPDEAVRFVPRAGWSGPVKLTYRLWDGTAHAAGEVVNLSARASVGGATPFSAEVATASVTVEAEAKPARPEPPAPWLTPTKARDLTGEGLAVVRLEGPGAWQYSLDDGRTWRDFGAAYHGRARLLGPADRVRFVPRPGARGKVVLGVRAWDGVGQPGATVSLATASSVGERSPFGDAVVTFSWRV